MNQKITYGYLFILLFGFISCQENLKEKSFIKPNILFIAIDDLRPELGNYGATHIQSPSIDKLATESLVFDRAYCNVPVCGALD